MKDKERLLSFESPLRFIFSHSALKEGWDNPNVFQVCTLIEQKSTFTARQKVGRGLRLCVNQDGERVEDKNINILHVMANESFTEFAETLQKEIEQETGVKFGILELSLFAGLTYSDTDGSEQMVSYDEAQELLTHFEKKGYIAKSGAIKDAMKEALSTGTLDLPAKFETARQRVETVIAKANTKPPIQDASKEVRVKLKKQVMISPEFLVLWDKIKGRTSYRVTLDENALIEKAVEILSKMEKVPKARVVTRTARVNVENVGVSVSGEYERSQELQNEGHRLPNFIRAIDDECFLSRRSAVEILVRSGRVQDYLNNPQKMIEMFIEAIRFVQGKMEIDGIRYQRLDGEEYYLQEIFDSEELIAYLDKNAIAVGNSLYDHIIYDSTTVERPFAVALDNDPDVKMFFKIPDKFKIETPIGTYNPDWAVYLDRDGMEKLYFVLETKGVSGLIGLEGLATAQRQKIHCGAEHFKALDSGVVFSDKPVKNWHEFKVNV